jgi:hypothetical protein
MTFLPRHPDQINVSLGRLARMPRVSPSASTAIGILVRGLASGVGVGIVLMAGTAGVGSIVGVGVLALGAALLSWDR